MSLGHFFSFYRSSVWNAWHYTEETLVHVFIAERKIQVGLIINEPVESESEHELSPFAIILMENCNFWYSVLKHFFVSTNLIYMMKWIFFIYFCRAIPKRLKDKLVSYILVLVLMIDEYTVECSVIMKDLGMSDSRYETNFGYWKHGK